MHADSCARPSISATLPRELNTNSILLAKDRFATQRQSEDLSRLTPMTLLGIRSS